MTPKSSAESSNIWIDSTIRLSRGLERGRAEGRSDGIEEQQAAISRDGRSRLRARQKLFGCGGLSSLAGRAPNRRDAGLHRLRHGGRGYQIYSSVRDTVEYFTKFQHWKDLLTITRH